MPETMTILSHVNPLLQMGVKDDVVFSFFKKMMMDPLLK